MAKVTYIEANGTSHVVDVTPGFSLMDGAVKNGVAGILADCGGSCACGTCRIYVHADWRHKTGDVSEIEEATLEIVDDPNPGKRLSCQIKITEDMDGLVVSIPVSQF